MTTTYHISGMTCNGCAQKVEQLVSTAPGVQAVRALWAEGLAQVEHNGQTTWADIEAALLPYPKYVLADKQPTSTADETSQIRQVPVVAETTPRTWWQTYQPLLIILGYIFGVSLAAQLAAGAWSAIGFTNLFMAGFFLVFSFFKLLNLPAFADSYAMYDVVAKRWHAYGYIYPFIELGLGLAFVLHLNPVATNTATLMVMSISLWGVLQSVLQRKAIQCACLGTVFNLPMSSVTVIEDGIMIAMSAAMLGMLL